MLICVGGGALIAGLALAAIVLRSPPLAHAPNGNRDFVIGRYPLPSYSIPMVPIRAGHRHTTSTVAGAISGIGLAVAMMVVLALIVAVGLGIASWWRRRPRRQAASAATVDPVPALRVGLREAQERLRFGAPDDAIVECWAALETAAARSGIAPDPADTPSELVIRILDSLQADSDALQTLSQLYHRARFGTDPTTDRDRDLARESLQRITAGLQERVP